MKNSILLLIVLLSINLSAQYSKGIIEGTVTDLQTGNPLIGANILIEGTTMGAAADVNGYYRIVNIPAGIYKLIAKFIGYQAFIYDSVKVINRKSITINFALTPEAFQVSEITVLTERPLIQKNVTNQTSIISSSDLYIRGSRADKLAYYCDGVLISSNTEEYAAVHENDFFNAFDKPLSTFSIDVDDASYSNCRRFIIENQLPPAGAVRVEEFINYFDYDYPVPEDDKPFSVTLEYNNCPWNKDAKLVHIGLKGEQIDKKETKASNLVFLLDVSGSMDMPAKLPLVQKAFNLLVDQLQEKDKVAIVVYAGAAGVVLHSTSANKKDLIKDAINNLHAGGSTAGGEGLMLAYKIAEDNFIEEGNNRIILATDGDFNVGISSTSELVKFIEAKRDKGIFFTALGFGMGNYKDDRLQQLADKGNGNHAYIDNIMEAKKVFVNELFATLYNIAKDVKIQVEFNPAKVKSYRLIGYENRLLNDQDFEDDTKDAGEIGSGHTVTALYEIIPNKDNIEIENAALKYQVKSIKPEAFKNEELLSLKIRYKHPDGEKSTEYETVLFDLPAAIENASDNFLFSSAIAEFAMLLTDSKYKGTASFQSVIDKALKSAGRDEFGYRKEFINLVERALLLAQNKISEAEK